MALRLARVVRDGGFDLTAQAASRSGHGRDAFDQEGGENELAFERHLGVTRQVPVEGGGVRHELGRELFSREQFGSNELVEQPRGGRQPFGGLLWHSVRI